MGVLYPYLGRPGDLGIHARFWGGVALLASCVIAYLKKDETTNHVNLSDIGITLVLFITYVIFSNQSQIADIFPPSLSGDYVVRKLSIFIYAAIIPAVLVRIVLVLKLNKEVLSGVLIGFALLSLFALIIVFQYWNYIFMATNQVTRELKALNEISTIGLSLIFTIAYFSLVIVTSSRKNFYLYKVPFLLLLISMVILLRQRAHLFLIVFLSVPFFIKNWSKKDGLIIMSMIAVGVVALLLTVDFSNFADTKLSKYWVKVIQGELFDTRLPIFQAAIDGIIAQPWGHGVGAFASNHPAWSYPHNLLLESFYETGIIGGVIATYIVIMVATQVWRFYKAYFTDKNASSMLFSYGSILLLLLLHQLKAGGIESIGVLLILWYLSNGLVTVINKSHHL